MTKKQHKYIHNAGLWLCGTGVLLSFFCFVLALRGIGVAIWPQSEPVSGALHISAFISTLGLAMLSVRSNTVACLFKNPLVLCPFLIALVSILLLPFHDLVLRSFLGSVRAGEGIIWWFNVAVLTASSMLLWRVKVWRIALTSAAFLSFLICFSLTGTHVMMGHFVAPLFFPDYAAFMILALLPVAYMAWSKRVKGWFFYLSFYMALNGLFYLTKNNTIIAFGLVAPLFFWGVWALKGRAKIGLSLSYLAVAALPVFVVALFLILSNIQPEGGYYAFVNKSVIRTVSSRAFLVDMVLSALAHRPETFITGYGWGTFADHMARYQPTQWVDFTRMIGTQWDGLRADHFHSHNMFVGTLGASGVFGMILLFLYFMAFPVWAKKEMKKPAFIQGAGFMAWASLWFLLPLQLPFLAFAAASTAKTRGLGYLKNITPRTVFYKMLFTGALLAVGAVQIAGGIVVFKTANNTHGYEPEFIEAGQTSSYCPMTYNDYGAGGLHLSKILTDRLRYVVDLGNPESELPKTQGPEAIPAHLKNLNHLFCQADIYIKTRPTTARLQIAHLIMRGELLLGLYDYMDEDTRALYYEGWEEELARWLRDSPNRVDIASPYLLYNMVHGLEERSRDIVEQLYTQNPDHPLGLWFKGLSLLDTPRSAPQGLDMMRKALGNGIERFIPVEDDIRVMLLPE